MCLLVGDQWLRYEPDRKGSVWAGCHLLACHCQPAVCCQEWDVLAPAPQMYSAKQTKPKCCCQDQHFTPATWACYKIQDGDLLSHNNFHYHFYVTMHERLAC